LNGGYDEGYSRCQCFWGRSAGSLVLEFIASIPAARALQVLDLGCGEGKNANAFAAAGSSVVAVDCSASALANGQRAFHNKKIDWRLSDAEAYLLDCHSFDVVVMYGLLHCLPSPNKIATLIDLALRRTRPGGYHIVATFNDGPHDLSAHPGFLPTLIPHRLYLHHYANQEIRSHSNSLIHETHPHNGIPHFHSLTRLVVRKKCHDVSG
jgi:tellurite methyltransferase